MCCFFLRAARDGGEGVGGRGSSLPGGRGAQVFPLWMAKVALGDQSLWLCDSHPKGCPAFSDQGHSAADEGVAGARGDGFGAVGRPVALLGCYLLPATAVHRDSREDLEGGLQEA